MTKQTFTAIALIAILLANTVLAQDQKKDKKWSLDGYISNVQSVIIMDSLKDYWINDNLFHNRLNFHWFPSKALSVKIEMRNRFMYGDQIKGDTGGTYIKSLAEDNGIADMSWNLAHGKSYVLNSMIDRALIQYTLNKFELTAGRQRINWGQTFVWNPNDIFNTYSFFDFDYPEKPGSDAIRLQFYPNTTSVADMAVKADSAGNITAAGLYRFNKFGYDIQFLTGVLNSQDLTLGMGWSGNIKSVSFRGEMSYFHPYRNFADTTGLFYFTIGLDYLFGNSFYLQFEALYMQVPKSFNVSNFLEFYSGPLSVKNLSFTSYNLFVQGSYPITPLLNGTLAVMSFPEISGYYVGPSLSYSLTDNLDFSLYVQLFSGKFNSNRQNFNLGFLRFKYSF